jgi:hypothetical protein
MSEIQQDLSVSALVHAMARNVFFVLFGAAALVLKRHYSGPFAEIIYGYGGNVSASFAVYFVFRIFTSGWILTSGWRYGRLVTAGIALLVVELFEATNGFGVMTNVYDPVDYLANVLGIALACCVDLISARLIQANSPRN